MPLLDIFQHEFMLRAFGAGLIISIIAPLIGTFLVVRGLSLLAETLAHVSLLGVALGLLLKIHPVLSGIVIAMLAALGIENLRGGAGSSAAYAGQRPKRRMSGEATLALFLSGSLAVASILISLAQGFNRNLLNYLFGSITTVSATDLWLIAGLAAVIALTFFAFLKELFLVSFDDELAFVSGIPARAINIILVLLAAATVALAMPIVGVLLIGALMVIPVMTAMNLSNSFRQTLLLAVVLSLAAVVSGLFISYYFDLASGGTIVVVSLVLFLGSLLWRR